MKALCSIFLRACIEMQNWKQIQYNPFHPFNTQPNHAELLQVCHQAYNQIYKCFEADYTFYMFLQFIVKDW